MSGFSIGARPLAAFFEGRCANGDQAKLAVSEFAGIEGLKVLNGAVLNGASTKQITAWPSFQDAGSSNHPHGQAAATCSDSPIQ